MTVSVLFSSGVMKMTKNDRDELNALANEYYIAKNQNNGNDEKRLYRELLFKINIVLGDMIYNSENSNARIEAIDKGIDVSIRDYVPGKGKVFTSYLYEQIKFKGMDEGKRERKRVPSDDESDIIVNIPDNADVSEAAGSDYIRSEIRIKLPTLITRFYEHNGSGKYSEIRHSYFKIFYTENIICLIASTNSTEGFNKAEAYECSDQELVRFVSFSNYISLDDLVYLKLKKRSDVLPDNSEDGLVIDLMAKEPKFQNDVIIEYRFVSKLDKKRVSSPNITQYRNRYENDCKRFFEYLKS